MTSRSHTLTAIHENREQTYSNLTLAKELVIILAQMTQFLAKQGGVNNAQPIVAPSTTLLDINMSHYVHQNLFK